jgi:hypothetical protein
MQHQLHHRALAVPRCLDGLDVGIGHVATLAHHLRPEPHRRGRLGVAGGPVPVGLQLGAVQP